MGLYIQFSNGKVKRLTWKDVLDSAKDDAPYWGHINDFFKIAQKTGYKYFTWNGVIYQIIDGNTWQCLNINKKELED